MKMRVRMKITVNQWLVFLILGAILFTVGACVLSCGFIAMGNAAETEATIIDVSHSGEKTAYVSYHYEGHTYHNVRTGFYSSDMKPGGKLKIYVNKEEPAEIVNTFFFFIFGGVFTFIGLVFIVVSIVLRKRGSLPMYYTQIYHDEADLSDNR